MWSISAIRSNKCLKVRHMTRGHAVRWNAKWLSWGAGCGGLVGMTAVTLRPLRPSDAKEMTRVLADPSLYVFTGGEPPSEAELEGRYEVQARGRSEDGSDIWLNYIVLVEARPVGYVQATIPTTGDPAEIAWVIGVTWQGRGYATAASQLLLDELRGLGVSDIIAHIHPDHQASQHIARRLGMQATDVVQDGETRWVGSLT